MKLTIDQARMSRHCIVRLVLKIIFMAFSVPLYAQNGSDLKSGSERISAQSKEWIEHETRLLNILSDDKLWGNPTDPTTQVVWGTPDQNKTVLRALEEVAILRPRALAPILSRHLLYQPRLIETLHRPGKTVEERYPVVEILVRLGLSAVPVIFEEIKKNQSPYSDAYLGIALYCLVKIYDEGGYGRELTRLRIETEVERSSGIEKDRLAEFLGRYNEKYGRKK